MQWYTKTTYHLGLAEDFIKAIQGLKGKKVAVLSHVRSDGDAIGSQIAMCRVLKALGAQAIAVHQDVIPRVLAPFIKDTPFMHIDSIDLKGYLAVTVDCASSERIGTQLVEKFPEIYMNVDHHVSNPAYAKYNFIVSESAATAEILAELFFSFEMPIDSVAAHALYLGIATDTGQFRYSNTTARVFEICQKLIDLGASPVEMNNQLYERETLGRIHLLHHFLGTLKLELGGQVCSGFIKEDFFKKTHTTSEDAEGFVDYTRSIDGVRIGLYIEEKDGSIKGSLRAKNSNYDLDKLAQQFNGGGHAAAAGFRIKNAKIEEAYPLLIKALEERINNYK